MAPVVPSDDVVEVTVTTVEASITPSVQPLKTSSISSTGVSDKQEEEIIIYSYSPRRTDTNAEGPQVEQTTITEALNDATPSTEAVETSSSNSLANDEDEETILFTASSRRRPITTTTTAEETVIGQFTTLSPISATVTAPFRNTQPVPAYLIALNKELVRRFKQALPLGKKNRARGKTRREKAYSKRNRFERDSARRNGTANSTALPEKDPLTRVSDSYCPESVLDTCDASNDTFDASSDSSSNGEEAHLSGAHGVETTNDSDSITSPHPSINTTAEAPVVEHTTNNSQNIETNSSIHINNYSAALQRFKAMAPQIFKAGGRPSLLPFALFDSSSPTSWAHRLVRFPGATVASPELYRNAVDHWVSMGEAFVNIFFAPESYDMINDNYAEVARDLVLASHYIVLFAPYKGENLTRLQYLSLEVCHRCNRVMHLRRVFQARQQALLDQTLATSTTILPLTEEYVNFLNEYPCPESIVDKNMAAVSYTTDKSDTDNGFADDEELVALRGRLDTVVTIPAPFLTPVAPERESFAAFVAMAPSVAKNKIKNWSGCLVAKLKSGIKLGFGMLRSIFRKSVAICGR